MVEIKKVIEQIGFYVVVEHNGKNVKRMVRITENYANYVLIDRNIYFVDGFDVKKIPTIDDEIVEEKKVEEGGNEMKLSKKNQDSKMAEIVKEFGEKWEATTNTRKDTLGQCTSCIAWEIGEKIENNITCICDKLNLDNFGDVNWCDKTGCYFEELKNKGVK